MYSHDVHHSLCARTRPLLPFVRPIVLLCICGLLPITFVSCVVSPRAHKLPLMIFVSCIVTLHAHDLPTVIFAMHAITLHAHELPPVIFVLHIVTLCVLHSPLNPFCCTTSNLGGGCVAFLIFPSMP
jgi:hypothetical protein